MFLRTGGDIFNCWSFYTDSAVSEGSKCQPYILLLIFSHCNSNLVAFSGFPLQFKLQFNCAQFSPSPLRNKMVRICQQYIHTYLAALPSENHACRATSNNHYKYRLIQGVPTEAGYRRLVCLDFH